MSPLNTNVIATEVLSHLENNVPIDEEIYIKLFTLLSDCIKTDTYPDEFDELIAYLHAQYTYNEDDRFDIGACWAAMNVFKYCREYKTRQAYIEQKKKLLKKYKSIVTIIKNNPGITENDIYWLYDFSQKPSPEISDILQILIQYRLIVTDIKYIYKLEDKDVDWLINNAKFKDEQEKTSFLMCIEKCGLTVQLQDETENINGKIAAKEYHYYLTEQCKYLLGEIEE